MISAPGSFLWLLAHDLRLNWRQLTHSFAGWPVLRATGAVVGGLAALHAIAWAALQARTANPGLLGAQAAATVATGVLLWMVAQGLLGASRTLYERGDLDMLFAAPLAPWKPVVSRALAIALSSAGSLAPMILPLANMGTILDGPSWLSLYPILAAMALFGTACGFILAIALFAAVGPKRARRISQILAAVIAGAFVLAVQIGLMLPEGMAAQAVAWVKTVQQSLWTGQGWLAFGFERAAQGDAFTLAALVAMSIVFFGVSVFALSEAFVSASLIASGAEDGFTHRGATQTPFREGSARSLRLKEWRLLIRDPNLASQLSLQIIYTLPLAGLLLRNPHDIPPAVAITPLIVVLAAQISASLAWIAVSGEDAPELIATAPISARNAALAKLSAIAVPLITILLLPVAALLVVAPFALPYALIFGTMAAVSTATLNFWHPSQGNRRGLLRRHSQSKLIAVAEHGLALLWAVTVVIAMADLAWALVPMLLIVGVLWLFAPVRLRLPRFWPMAPVPKSAALQQI